jgi:hypothetical protein
MEGLIMDTSRYSTPWKRPSIGSGRRRRSPDPRRIETLVAALETAGEDFTVNLWGSMVEKVTVFEDGLVFTLTSGEDVRVAPC